MDIIDAIAYWYNGLNMESKPIQDVAPPPPVESKVNPTGSAVSSSPPPASPPPAQPAAPESSTGPEIVDNIPVQPPTALADDVPKPSPPKDNDLNFIVPTTPPPAAINLNKEKLKPKDGNKKPTLAIAVALLAIICLAAGAYLKFFKQ